MNYILDMREQVVVMLIWSYQKKEKEELLLDRKKTFSHSHKSMGKTFGSHKSFYNGY